MNFESFLAVWARDRIKAASFPNNVCDVHVRFRMDFQKDILLFMLFGRMSSNMIVLFGL
jgi:hypothetical protein